MTVFTDTSQQFLIMMDEAKAESMRREVEGVSGDISLGQDSVGEMISFRRVLLLQLLVAGECLHHAYEPTHWKGPSHWMALSPTETFRSVGL